MSDDTYIKMVLALPEEFFKGWEWKEGDRFYIKGYGEDVRVIGNSVLNLGKPAYWKGYLIHGDWDHFKIIPVPSQKQLQEMINISPIEFIEDLYEYSQDMPRPDEYHEIFKIDMDCFTLAYVMYRKYKKYWNGEAWI